VNILAKVGDILGGAFGLVDDLHTSDEEKLQLKSGLLQIQTGVVSEVIQAQSKMAEMQAGIIKAEAESSHWLTSTWRPITMLTFLALIVLAQLGFTEPVPADMWPLLKLGLGGYVIGRSFEKTVPGVLSSLKAEEKA
tara:strand:- start:194 stop:604 length:411 start_codon:yes stop_codon:yes gene_type:complete